PALEPRLAQIRTLLAQESPTAFGQIDLLLAELRAFCPGRVNRRLRLETELHAALLEDLRGNHDAAISAVLCLVHQVGADGWVRQFVDLGEPAERLLRRALVHADSPQ